MSVYPSSWTSRRQAMGALALAVPTAAGAPAMAASAVKGGAVDYADPMENLRMFGKLISSFGKPSIGGYTGLMYGKMPGKRALPLFRYVGMGVQQCKWVDGKVVHRTRECGLFADIHTNEILEYWDNPYTGKRDRVYHFYNDLTVNTYGPEIEYYITDDTHVRMNDGTVFPQADGRIPFRMPFRHYGSDQVTMEWDFTMDHANQVTPEGWPTYSSGPVVTPSEHFVIYASRAELESRDTLTAQWRAGFTRISEPWPFMRMREKDFPGFVLMGRQASIHGLGYDSIDPKTLAYLRRHAPEYLELPEDRWTSTNERATTWRAFVMDVPPEVKGYPWRGGAQSPGARPLTGLGADF